MAGIGAKQSMSSVPVANSLAEDSPLLTMFQKAAKFLTNRHDRHERIVKLSRDITIESKRIIFLLHSPVTKVKSREDIINEAKGRLDMLIHGPIKAIAVELENRPAYLHSKASSGGMQEFVEARTFCSYMENNHVMTQQEIQAELKFTLMSEDGSERTVSALLLPQDYILGLADLGGEVMRKTISAISAGAIDECMYSCDMIRKLFVGFKEISRPRPVLLNKMKMTRKNLKKVEHALRFKKIQMSEVVPASMPPAATTDQQPVKQE